MIVRIQHMARSYNHLAICTYIPIMADNQRPTWWIQCQGPTEWSCM